MKPKSAPMSARRQCQFLKPLYDTTRAFGIGLFAVLVTGQIAQAQTPLLQLKAGNYNPSTGLWTATVGANAQASGAFPTLAAGVSPNGSPAVVFNGANSLTLASSLAAINGYTAIAYIKPSTTSGTLALCGGAAGAFEFRISSGKQDALRQQQADLGASTTVLSTTAFSIVAVTVTNVGGGGYRLNGFPDGNNTASAFTAAISAIGARASGTGQENFNGSVCEIDIFSGVLTTAQIIAIEAAMTNSYITVTPTPPAVLADTTATPAVATVGGNDSLTASFNGTLPLNYQWLVSLNSNGSGSSIITGATNSTLVLSNLQFSDSGKYYSLRATNTVSPYSTNSSWLQLNVVALTPTVQLMATNYDGSSVWSDSSGNGNNATYSGATAPTLATFVTPNGGPAVNISSGSGSFLLASSLLQSGGYTVFAYCQVAVGTTRNALVGGSANTALEYDIFNHHQNYLSEFVADVGSGTATIPTTSFSLIDLAVNSSGASFRYNGASDGTVGGTAFGVPITRIGNNHGLGDGYIGQIAEIDIYTNVLTSIQISNVEAQLTAKYVTANSIVIGAATVSPTNNTFAGNPITLAASVIGGTGTTTYRWQTDNASGGASFADIGGATSTNYLLNTTGLLGTYQYRMIGTPFGGTPVTNTPVTLTVQAASAPIVVRDTTASPATATINGNVTFSAGFVGNLPIAYQWQVSPNPDGSGATSLTASTNTTLVLTNLQLSDSGKYYSLRATNKVSPYIVNSTWLQLTVVPLTPLVQFIGTNYDSGGAVWHDSSGNANDAYFAGSTPPTLAPFVTPNGGSAVSITASGSFLLTSALDPSVGYTVFAYLKPSSTSGRHAITGGSSPLALEYDIYNGSQDYLTEYTADIGHGTVTNLPTTSFSLLNLAVNSSGAAFRLNGAPDGTVPGSSFGSPITRLGNNEGAGDGLVGQVAEIDVYSGVLSSIQISNVEAQLTAKYVTANSIAIGSATVSPTNNTYAGNPVTLSAPVIGGTGTTAYQWQTDNTSGGASFSNVSGATTTNFVLNTTSLLGTYEFQLVGTPFGGGSVTSAPVTLTVQAATAPIVIVDTAASPSTATVNGNDTLTATFNGTLPIRYQWQVSPNPDGSGATSLTAATNTTLVLTNLQLSDSGKYYSLRATNTISPYIVNSSWLQLNVQALVPMVQLIATNYDPSGGIWTDTSGNNNNGTYSGGLNPTIDASVTPNGGSAVNVASAGGSFALTAPLDPGLGYTVFAYVKPTSTTGRHAITGGSSPGALEYDIFNGNQDYLTEYTADIGHGVATIPTTSFSMVGVAVNSSGASFRLNGASDGTVGGATFSSAITRIGNNEGGGDSYTGDIAEIDIYSGVLSSLQISTIESQLSAKYGVASAVNTTATNITGTVTGNALTLSWPVDHIGWTLQAQTNALSTGLGTNWVRVASSTTTNKISVPIAPANGSVFYRLVYP